MNNKKQGKLIVLVAPSGSGKTTIAKRMLSTFPKVKFSISATTRKPREGEKNGADYFYLSNTAFKNKIDEGKFVEWEKFYDGTHYGTLHSEVDKMMEKGYFPLLDIEVKGATNIKRLYGDQCVTIFIQPPSLDELKKRLVKRGTETKESLQKRLTRAEKELKYADKFDYIVINDNLDQACKEVESILKTFISYK